MPGFSPGAEGRGPRPDLCSLWDMVLCDGMIRQHEGGDHRYSTIVRMRPDLIFCCPPTFAGTPDMLRGCKVFMRPLREACCGNGHLQRRPRGGLYASSAAPSTSAKRTSARSSASTRPKIQVDH